MYLVINDSILSTFVALVKKDKILALPIERKGKDILAQIVKLTKSNNFNWKKIKGIIILSDSASFTQTRIIVTIANVLGEFFNVPRSFIRLHHKDKLDRTIEQGIRTLKNKLIFPSYNKKPNIGKSN